MVSRIFSIMDIISLIMIIDNVVGKCLNNKFICKF